MHKPLDPRAERILELADERGVSGTYVALARAAPRRRGRGLGQAADDERLDADRRRDARPRLPGDAVKAVPILARTASLLAHLAEEQELPIGFLMAARGRGRGQLRAMSDDAAYREQIAYLLERSAFYRDKLGIGDARRRAAWTRSPRCR